jgi:hypothetical protein
LSCTHSGNEEDKILNMKAMTWPPGKGIPESPPVLVPMTTKRAAFIGYTRALVDLFLKFYQEDVTLYLSSSGHLNGRSEIIAFYSKMFTKIRESLEIQELICEDNRICVKMSSTFTSIEDSREYFGNFKIGETKTIKVYVIYLHSAWGIDFDDQRR